MAFARSSFRQEDFDEVESLLIAHEEMLETEFRNLKRDYEQMVKECELLKEGNDALKIENSELKEELKKRRIEFEELRQQLISLEIEKNRIIEGLTGEKGEAEEMVAMHDSRLMDVDMKLLNLEELVAQIMRVPVEILRSGAFVAGVRMNVDVPVHEVQNGGIINWENFQNGVLNHEEVSANGVNIPVHDGQSGGIDMESFQNGVIDHAEGENGDFSLENLNNESGDDFEDSQTLELFLSIQQHFARSMIGNQGSDLPIEGNGNVNAEASSVAQSTSDCPQVESVACDMEKDNDESPDTVMGLSQHMDFERENLIGYCFVQMEEDKAASDFNDKELLRNNVRMLNSHNVVLFPCDVQAACDTPQIGFNSFSQGKENKMLKAAGRLGKVRGGGSLQIALRKSLFDDTDDSNGCSSNDSEDESCLESCMDKILTSFKRQNMWKFAAYMLSDFEKDYELCMNAVCALYRKKISAEKSIMKLSIPTDPGFSYFGAISCTKLAEFLIDGDPWLKLKRTVSEVQQKDPKLLSKCKDLVIQHFEKLFEIYQKEQDPFFHPKF